MSEAPAVLEVVAAVISDQGQFLVCRRNADRPAGGQWEFPGGKIDPGESAEFALVREIQEELDIAIRVVSHLSTDDTVVGSLVIRLICFRCELKSERPKHSSDHDRLEWVDAAALSERHWALPDLPAVRLLAAQATGSES